MYPANHHLIRPATTRDDITIESLAALDSQRPIASPALIGEIDGRAVAAISLADGRVVADPFVHTAQLVAVMRVRAGAHHAYAKQPSLRERIRAGLRPRVAAGEAA